ncbi:beta-ketoacyl synthase N-terminal-like domain-containing protein [Nocardiopsis metallicus]|uniref:Acyl transferase domain-containing protein n=1 Tax=Nocardiopsis metallicus TaxID=179819 RepID=A0A840WS70_9ACTN|nr:type I polyketide synthase [Nocardiopsis metallicus]MBB5494775.1 acyl transferase domain-containing protein [Nocardiopsis metallicus]
MSAPRVALLGMGLRLPGSITSPADLEHALEQGGSVVGPVPEQRWKGMCEDLHPDEVPEQPWTLGVVDDLERFDHAFFSISVDEAAQMDPQQKKLLEVVYEAVQDAGICPSSLAGPRTGVYTGAASFDRAAHAFAPGTASSVHAASGASMAVLANRISYHLDAQGPSLNFDSACSASGTALHYALRDLRSGVVDTAIVAGANSLEAAPITAGFHKLGVLAPDGVCAPFDTDAHGYVRSEGMVAVVLRRTENVDPRVHRVYAHLAGSGLSHGGRAPHLVAPRAPHQARAITQALVDAQLTPAQVGVVHAHGTGTKAGDLEETRGLTQGYTDHQPDDSCLLVSSSKAALGHTEGAAALVGVCVMALGLHRHQVWPTVDHTQPLPLLGKKGMRVPTRIEPWPHMDGQPLAGGVSAFGFGGSNAHIIMTCPPPPSDDASRPTQGARRLLPALLPISAHTRPALTHTATRWAQHLPGQDLHTVAAAAMDRRDHHRHRAAVVTFDTATAAQALEHLGRGAPHEALVGPYTPTGLAPEQLAFVYSGHGSHHEHMAVELAAALPEFADALERARQALGAQVGRPVWAPGEALDGFETIQHAGWIVQVALTDTLSELGIRPTAVVGHSAGEVAAAYAAGALDLEQSAHVMAARSRHLATLGEAGGMLAVALEAEQAHTVASDTGLEVAVTNSPQLSVLSGAHAGLERAAAHLAQQQVWCSPIADVIPAHSSLVEPLQPALRADLVGLDPRPAHALFISTACGAPLQGQELTGTYWAEQIRRPVRFTDAITALTRDQATGCVEIGARPVLSGHISDTAPGTAVATATTDPETLMRALAGLYVHGHTPTRPTFPATAPTFLPALAWDHHPSSVAPAAAVPAVPEQMTTQHILALLCGLIARTSGVQVDPSHDATAAWGALGVTSLDLVAITGQLRAAHRRWAHLTHSDLIQARTLARTCDLLVHLETTAPPTLMNGKS